MPATPVHYTLADAETATKPASTRKGEANRKTLARPAPPSIAAGFPSPSSARQSRRRLRLPRSSPLTVPDSPPAMSSQVRPLPLPRSNWGSNCATRRGHGMKLLSVAHTSFPAFCRWIAAASPPESARAPTVGLLPPLFSFISSHHSVKLRLTMIRLFWH
jgi:hypothetical protein